MGKAFYGGFITKKYIIIGVTLLVTIAALVTGIWWQTRDIQPKGGDATMDTAALTGRYPLLSTVIGVDPIPRSPENAASDHTAKNPAQSDTDPQPEYTADTIPPITGLKRLSESAGVIDIGWNEIPGVQGYRIERRDENIEGDDYAPFSTVKYAGLHILNLDEGSKYSFRITPYIKNGVEGKTAEITVSTVPCAVNGLSLKKATKDSTTFTWEKNERADGYTLQRCAAGAWSDYQEFDADTTEFTDTGLKSGKAYYYRLIPFREDSTGRLSGADTTLYTVAGLVGPKDDHSASKLGRVSLDYKKSAYADGYIIYYSKDQENWEKLKTTSKTHFSTSRLENGKTYYFRIFPYRKVDKHTITGTPTEMEFVAKKEIYDKNVGDTYVEVSLSDQHMWYIVDGDVYLHSDCVTGNYGSADTPKGFFSVNAKISPCTLKGDDYVSYVTYWMPFIGGGWGLHDATWRSSFGGSIYKGNGSHGCVNLPTAIAKKMYAHIKVGTPVIVY